MTNEKNYYEGYIIKYLDSKHNIDRLPIGIALVGDLKSWLGYIAVWLYNHFKSNIDNYLYDSNNFSQKRKDMLLQNMSETNRQM